MYSTIMHYAKTGELNDFTTLEEANQFARFSTERMMSGGGDSVRERITVELVHGKHIDGKHGWDGTKGKFQLEVKNETIGENKSVDGRGIFNNITWKSFSKYENDEGLFISAGYSRTGVLLYALAFNMKHLNPILEAKLESVLPNRIDKNKKNVTVNVSSKDFPEEFEVIYLPENMKRSDYSRRMWKLLGNNYADRTKLGKKLLSAKPAKKKPTAKKTTVKNTKVTRTRLTHTDYMKRAEKVFGGNVSYIEIAKGNITLYSGHDIIHKTTTKNLNARYNRKLSQS